VISRSGEVIGGLFFGHPEVGVFDARAERLISGVAAQGAIAIDNARLYEKVRDAAEERKKLLNAERVAREEAEHINVIKDEFLGTLSHELRTPLSAILLWAQVLRKAGDMSDDFEEGLDAIERNARAQTQLIDDLLDMSQIMSGKSRLELQSTDLSEVIEWAVDSVRPSAEAKKMVLRMDVESFTEPVPGDPRRLQQVVWNLLTNAIKFTPNGGEVVVKLERVNSRAEIIVQDSGIGIEAGFLPLVFERFRQADASTTRSYGGLGLGLSIVKDLVELHGGTVRAHSDGEGQGATFTVSLPLTGDGTEVQEQSGGSKPGVINCDAVDLDGVSVLVVDDEPDARTLIHRILTYCEAEVFTAASGAEGLQLLKTHRPDVLISDIGMPETDGFQFIRQVRQLSPEEGAHTPAIALTAFASSEDRTAALLAGFQVYVVKPIEAQELLVTVANLLGRSDSTT
jgi:signal transduction histidine kinase/ActR/RegA family two-component response regulator